MQRARVQADGTADPDAMFGAMVLPLANTGPSTVEWIASLLAVGGFPILGTYFSDRRRIHHERGLKAADSLSAHIEEVQVALEELADNAAALRQRYLSLAATRPEEMWPLIRAAEDSFQKARAAIARLGIQPHADDVLVKTAEAAAKAHHAAVKAVRSHQLNADMARHSGQQEPIDGEAPGVVIESIEDGCAATRRYEELAREAIKKLLG
jgi:hypothetical protein